MTSGAQHANMSATAARTPPSAIKCVVRLRPLAPGDAPGEEGSVTGPTAVDRELEPVGEKLRELIVGETKRSETARTQLGGSMAGAEAIAAQDWQHVRHAPARPLAPGRAVRPPRPSRLLVAARACLAARGAPLLQPRHLDGTRARAAQPLFVDVPLGNRRPHEHLP